MTFVVFLPFLPLPPLALASRLLPLLTPPYTVWRASRAHGAFALPPYPPGRFVNEHVTSSMSMESGPDPYPPTHLAPSDPYPTPQTSRILRLGRSLRGLDTNATTS